MPSVLAPVLQDERKFFLVSPDGDVLDLPPRRLDQGPEWQRRLQAELAVQLMTPDLAQVVPSRVEEQGLQQLARALHSRRIAGPQAAVDLNEGFLYGLRPFSLLDRILGERRFDRRITVVELEDFLVALVPQRAQQHRDRDFPGAVDAGGDDPVVVHLQFQPGPAVGDHGGRRHGPTRRVGGQAVVHARGANQLADHHPLRAIYNEGPALGHHREVPHEDLLLFDLAGLLDDQADLHLERGAVVVVAIAAFFLTVLQPFQAVSAVVEDRRLLECAGQLDALATGVEGEVQLQVPREVLDGGNLIEDLTDSLAQEPLVGTPLHFNKIRHIQNLGNLRETTPRAPAAGHDLTRHRQPGAGRGRRGGANNLASGACLHGEPVTSSTHSWCAVICGGTQESQPRGNALVPSRPSSNACCQKG